MTRKIVVGISGASGAPYARRLLEYFDNRMRGQGDVEVAICLSSTAAQVWELECGGDIHEALGKRFSIWDSRDYRAPFASGSAGWHAMAIVPCSMGTVGRIAHGISDTLLTRAADVMIKERRTLVIVPREMPLSVIHLENLTALARAGVVVQPAMPSFYGRTKTLEDAIDTVVGRTLDQLGFEHDWLVRWGTEKGKGTGS